MKPDDKTPQFKTALELASNTADAFVFCANCGEATAHRQESDGTLSCHVCEVDQEDDENRGENA